MRVATPLVLLAVALACPLFSEPAEAQRVFVSATGSDGNPCTFTSPCRTFQHAHDVTSSGGEIDVLDPAGYGAVAITKSISIQGHGYSGISAGSSTTAVTINAAFTDTINLNGLLIDGGGVGVAGVQLNAGGTLSIENCLIRGFGNTGTGINFAPSGTGSFASSNLYLSNTLVSNNGIGVRIRSLDSSVVSVVLNKTELANNTASGLTVDGTSATGAISVSVANSVIMGGVMSGAFSSAGISAASAVGHSTVNVMVQGTSISNIAFALLSNGPNVTVRVSQSTITANDNAFVVSNGGGILTYGNNNVDGNGSNVGSTGTLTQR
jgi:hypothetical protein